MKYLVTVAFFKLWSTNQTKIIIKKISILWIIVSTARIVYVTQYHASTKQYIYIRLIALEEFVETNINPLRARFTATTLPACWLCLRSTPVEPHTFSLFAEILTESFRTGSSSPFCSPLLHPTWCKSRKSPRTYTTYTQTLLCEPSRHPSTFFVQCI